MKTFLGISLLLLLLANNSAAQAPAWPGFKDPRLNLFIHDELHAVTAVAVAEGLGVLTSWPSDTRYGLSTIVLPIAQETSDYIYWHKTRGLPWNLRESVDDIVTYQSAWTVYFIRKKQWGFALATFVLPTAFTYARNY